MPHIGDTKQLESWAENPANQSGQSTATLIWFLKKTLEGGTNFTSFQPQSWFWGLSLKTYIWSHSICEGISFLWKKWDGPPFFLNPGQGRQRHKYLIVSDSSGIWEILVSLPHLLVRSPANLSCILHTRALFAAASATSPTGTAPLCRDDYQISRPASTRTTVL